MRAWAGALKGREAVYDVYVCKGGNGVMVSLIECETKIYRRRESKENRQTE